MRIGPQSGALVVSIDVDADPRLHGTAVQAADRSLISELAGLMVEYKVPATWSMSDWSSSESIEEILRYVPPQELAILADDAWTGPAETRGQVARQLDRMALRAGASAFQVTTLALNAGDIQAHWDLVLKRGIFAIRGPVARSSGASWGGAAWKRVFGPAAAPLVEPRSVRYGLWELPTSIRWPVKAESLSMWRGGVRIKRGINRAVRLQGIMHLVIDAPLLATAGGNGLAQVERMLALATEHRRGRSLQLESVVQTVQRVATPRSLKPAQSILRRAA